MRMAVGKVSRRSIKILLSLCMTVLAAWSQSQRPANGIQVLVDSDNRKVDVLVDGQPFTSYIYPTTLKEAGLFPLRTAEGGRVTRSFPPGPGERTEHPHHVGLWFNYGNV